MKKRLQHKYFPANIAKFLKTSLLKNICEGLTHLEVIIILLIVVYHYFHDLYFIDLHVL